MGNGLTTQPFFDYTATAAEISALADKNLPTAAEIKSLNGGKIYPGMRIRVDEKMFLVDKDGEPRNIWQLKHNDLLAGGDYAERDVFFVRPSDDNASAYLYIQPKGTVTSNAPAAIKLFADEYLFNDGQTAGDFPFNYRDCGMYFSAEADGLWGRPFVHNIKVNGEFFGVFPEHVIAFSEGTTPDSVPVRYLYYSPGSGNLYENSGRWEPGVAVSIGDRKVSGGVLYEAVTAGTTGVTAPTHPAGTASDGGVDWAFIVDYSTLNYRAVAVFGDRDQTPPVGFQDMSTFFGKEIGIGNNTPIRWFDSGASPSSSSMSLNFTSAGRLEFEGSSGGKVSIADTFTSTSGMAIVENVTQIGTGAVVNEVFDVSGVTKLRLNYSTGSSVAGITGGITDQVLRVFCTNSITFVHSTTGSSGIWIVGDEADYTVPRRGWVTLFKLTAGGVWYLKK